MKTIITHHRPHLDDICGAWLLKRFLSDFTDAKIDFIATSPTGNPHADTDEVVHIGVGRGQFDEHKGDLEDCATSLVFKFLQQTIELSEDTERALEKIVAWVLLEDTGQLATIEQRDFAVPAILKGEYERTDRDSGAVVILGFQLLDALLVTQLNIVQLERDWTKRIEFESRFGSAVALSSDASSADSFAYRQGFVLLANINNSGRYHSRTIRCYRLSISIKCSSCSTYYIRYMPPIIGIKITIG